MNTSELTRVARDRLKVPLRDGTPTKCAITGIAPKEGSTWLAVCIPANSANSSKSEKRPSSEWMLVACLAQGQNANKVSNSLDIASCQTNP